MRVTWIDSNNDRYYYITKSVRDGKKIKSVTVKKLGKLSELGYKSHEEALKELKEIAKEFSIKNKDSNLVTVSINVSKSLDDTNNKNTISNELNIGYLYLNKIYKDLGLSEYFKSLKKDKYKIKYNLDEIVKLLVFSRILNPKSKLGTFNDAYKMFGFSDIDLENIYRSLDILKENNDKIQETIYKNSDNVYKRDTRILYYDCTNFFSEKEYEDLDVIKDDEIITGLRKYGVSKENRPNPIVEVGLFMDKSGIPLAINIYPGNTNEQLTCIPLEKKIIKDYSLSKFIYCSDAGLGSMDIRKFNSFNNRAFVITRSVKKLSNIAKNIIFDDNNWRDKDNKIVNLSKIKENIDDLNTYYKVLDYYEDTELGIKIDGKKKVSFKQKLVVTYSNKYKEYQKRIRLNQIERAKKLIKNGSFDKENINSPKRYILKNYVTYNGEKAEYKIPELDYKKIDEESLYDGYYSVITNLEGSPKEIIRINENRWEIEESFRIMKTNLKSRPFYLSTKEHIEAHFLICFIALTIFRILEKELDNRYTVDEIISNLKNINVCPLKNETIYSSLYKESEFINLLDKKTNIKLSKEAFYINELKKYSK